MNPGSACRFATVISLVLYAGLIGTGCSKTSEIPKQTTQQASEASSAVKGAHPVVNQSGFLVGGTVDGNWLPAKQMAPHVRGGETYRLYGSKGPAGTATGGAPDRKLLVDLQPWEGGFLAVSGEWNSAPRKPKTVATLPSHTRAMASVLKEKGLASSPVTMSSVMTVDIDGKGNVVDVISASRMDPSSYTVGDYSTLVLMSSKEGEPGARVITGSFHISDNGSDVPVYYSLDGLWDLDGDGALEIVVGCACPLLESYGTKIYKWSPGGEVRLVAAVRPNSTEK